jgi:DNA-binding response OmpR family regulator
MLTSLDDEDSLKVAFSATGYITKPFTQMELVERMRTATTSGTINKLRFES